MSAPKGSILWRPATEPSERPSVWLLGNQLAPVQAYREAVLECRGLRLRTGRGRYGGGEASLKWADERASASTAAHLAKVQGESPRRHRGALGGWRWAGEEGLSGLMEVVSRVHGFGPKKLKFWLV